MPAVLTSLAWSAEAWVDILACRARLRLPRLLAAEPFLRNELTRERGRSRRTASLDGLLTAFGRALRAQPTAATCLPRSLALCRFLARHGHEGRVVLGLRNVGGCMSGHAWVETEGSVVSGDASFVRSFCRLKTGRTVAGRRIDG
jgi:Transglutaminase-like superfamily